MGQNPLSGHWSHELSPLRSLDWPLPALAHGPCVRPSHGVPQRPMAIHAVEQKKSGGGPGPRNGRDVFLADESRLSLTS